MGEGARDGRRGARGGASEGKGAKAGEGGERGGGGAMDRGWQPAHSLTFQHAPRSNGACGTPTAQMPLCWFITTEATIDKSVPILLPSGPDTETKCASWQQWHGAGGEGGRAAKTQATGNANGHGDMVPRKRNARGGQGVHCYPLSGSRRTSCTHNGCKRYEWHGATALTYLSALIYHIPVGLEVVSSARVGVEELLDRAVTVLCDDTMLLQLDTVIEDG